VICDQLEVTPDNIEASGQWPHAVKVDFLSYQGKKDVDQVFVDQKIFTGEDHCGCVLWEWLLFHLDQKASHDLSVTWEVLPFHDFEHFADFTQNFYQVTNKVVKVAFSPAQTFDPLVHFEQIDQFSVQFYCLLLWL
jgi:hypothetical protein